MSLAPALAYSQTDQASTVAGTVIMARGEVAAVDAGGSSRPLSRRDDIFVGETIFTNAGSSAQFRMVDGAQISLKESTEFAIVAYQYNESPADDRASLELITGGFRTITGNISRDNREAYEANAANFATIGIRGTDYEVIVTPAGEVLTGVFEGGITVSNNAGSLDLGIGAQFDFARVPDAASPPQGLTAQPTGLGNTVVIADDLDEEDDDTGQDPDDTDNDTDNATDDDSGDLDAEEINNLPAAAAGNSDNAQDGINIAPPNSQDFANSNNFVGSSTTEESGTELVEEEVTEPRINPNEATINFDGNQSTGGGAPVNEEVSDPADDGDTGTDTGSDDPVTDNDGSNTDSGIDTNTGTDDTDNSDNDSDGGSADDDGSDAGGNGNSNAGGNGNGNAGGNGNGNAGGNGNNNAGGNGNGNGNNNAGGNGNGNGNAGGNNGNGNGNAGGNDNDNAGGNGNGNGNAGGNDNGNGNAGGNDNGNGNAGGNDNGNGNAGGNDNGNGNAGGNDNGNGNAGGNDNGNGNAGGNDNGNGNAGGNGNGNAGGNDNGNGNGNSGGNSNAGGNSNSGGSGGLGGLVDTVTDSVTDTIGLEAPASSLSEHDIQWGKWNQPLDSNWLVVQEISDQLTRIDTGEYFAEFVTTDSGKLNGSHSYRTGIASSFIGHGQNGAISSLAAALEVNFDTGQISNGLLEIQADEQIWSVSFAGLVNQGLVQLDATGASLSNADGLLSEQIDSQLGGAFTGTNGEAFIGGFDLIDQLNPANQVNGLFTIER
jgi:hypothetical protein